MVRLAENTYGKCQVRVVRVKRDKPMHSFQEWSVEILLTGEFGECFTTGDNSRILATDTMKNTVYSLARDTEAQSIEDFALELSGYLVRNNPQVAEATISIVSIPWTHVNVDGTTFPSAFQQTSGELQTATVSYTRGGEVAVTSGLQDLVIMKTANSGFEGFIRDSHTTLPETADRLLGTAVRAQWKYSSSSVDFDRLRGFARNTLLKTFAEHESRSVQHTLYAMANALLESAPEIEDIQITMPNKHCLLVDLSRFGKTNPNEIFVPTDEPYGYIEARLCRGD
jgi:urate oxidase